MRRLLLARHGQSVSNAVRRFQGAHDVPLSELGEAQARALGTALRRRRLARVYTSPLLRARHTAELAVAELAVPVVPLADLRELSLGEWEGCTVEEIQAQTGNPYARWVRDPVACSPPGAEPLPEVQRRVVQVMADIAHRHRPDEDVLVVCHGGVISAYLAHCLGLALSSLWRLTVANGSLSEIAPPRVLRVNDTGHLTALPLAPRGGVGFSP
ncbi:MAG: histidine phosphatase family protein [Candidatus Rokubacteria bacterium]|nr:histidine phosphatase family protein [Candidatus Rokubacteria bacterium]